MGPSVLLGVLGDPVHKSNTILKICDIDIVLKTFEKFIDKYVKKLSLKNENNFSKFKQVLKIQKTKLLFIFTLFKIFLKIIFPYEFSNSWNSQNKSRLKTDL